MLLTVSPYLTLVNRFSGNCLEVVPLEDTSKVVPFEVVHTVQNNMADTGTSEWGSDTSALYCPDVMSGTECKVSYGHAKFLFGLRVYCDV